jgi:hypothetical protein
MVRDLQMIRTTLPDLSPGIPVVQSLDEIIVPSVPAFSLKKGHLNWDFLVYWVYERNEFIDD